MRREQLRGMVDRTLIAHEGGIYITSKTEPLGLRFRWVIAKSTGIDLGSPKEKGYNVVIWFFCVN